MSVRFLLSTTSVTQQNVEFWDEKKKEFLQQNPTHALMFNEEMEMDAAAMEADEEGMFESLWVGLCLCCVAGKAERV